MVRPRIELVTFGLHGILPNIGYAGICRCSGYGFQAFWSGRKYINEIVEFSVEQSIDFTCSVWDRVGIFYG